MTGPSVPPRAVVVGVGDELLLGRTVDTNGAWLARELSDLGFQVVRRGVVADLAGEIRNALDSGLEAADLLVFTGGLGPTPDDLTRPTVATALGRPLKEDPELVKGLRKKFQDRGYPELPPNNRLMAQVPKGARVLPNPQGSAPGLVISTPEGKSCVLLPGVPREMKGIFREGVQSYLAHAFGDRLAPVRVRMIYTTGIPESLLSQKMAPLLPQDLGPVSLAFLPDLRGVRIRFTAQGLSEEEARARFDALEAPLRELLQPYRYRAETGDLVEALGEALVEREALLAVAESCTGGLLAKRLTDRPGSSEYFAGGVVAYSNEVKVRELGVTREVLEAQGAVSGSVAREMARGVARRFGVRAGIGITGVAGPGGGTEEKPVGTVWMAVSWGGEVKVARERFPGNREEVRERAAQAAMALLLGLLENGAP